MDVEPVVGEEVAGGDLEVDEDGVPIRERVGRAAHALGSAGERLHEQRERHRRDDVIELRACAVAGLDPGRAPALDEHAPHGPLEVDGPARLAHGRGHPLVDHPCPAVRVGEAVDERPVLAALPEPERVLCRLEERELLDPLRGEVGVELATGDPPELFAVRLEEDLEEPPAEAPHDPGLERAVVRAGGSAAPAAAERLERVARHAARRLEEPEVRERIPRPERVMEESLLVVDPREPVDHRVVAPDDLEPEAVHARVGAEEAVGAEVDTLAPEGDRPREPTHAGRGLEHLPPDARLRKPVSGGEPGQAGAFMEP